MNELIPRATVESIVSLRNAALKKYDIVYETLTHAATVIADAKAAATAASIGITSYNNHSHNEREDFLFKLELAEPDAFKTTGQAPHGHRRLDAISSN